MQRRQTSWESGRTELLPQGYRVGSWEIGEPIGAGGWATVYAGRPARGRTGSADRTPLSPGQDGGGASAGGEVALKVMPTAGLAPRQARGVAEAARREVGLARRTGHPRLVRLLDSLALRAPEHPFLDGAIVLVMERAGGSLRDLLDGGVAEAEGARLIAGICEGLAHLHGAGWAHMDLKPENVLIGVDGSVKLSDFGLATELTGTHGHAPPMGTLDYLPPERWRAPLGDLGVQVRPSADIWALGIVIHEVFASGVSPFPGATPVARGAAVQEYAEGRVPLRMDAAVPEFWRALAADCLAPTHAARSAHTAASLLERITAHEAERAEPAPRSRVRRVWHRTRAAVLAVTVCGAAGAAVGAYSGQERPSEAPKASGELRSEVRVFNAERGCQDRADRDPQCSLGLAVDPTRPYVAENVVPTRVWDGDVLRAECRLPQGEPIIDEAGLKSTLWYRVRVPRAGVHTEAGADADGQATAWLPAVRTKDRPALARCPRPSAAR
ncbi:serine/threonine protein kinase [Streptomyces sp. WZ.A104]|nr:serine/threonine-protein kinase [Streptomyces sp. WZ.A104]PCG85231.1 serine/threonine protein kinase [Streptomyces sp. WZ.A104]